MNVIKEREKLAEKQVWLRQSLSVLTLGSLQPVWTHRWRQTHYIWSRVKRYMQFMVPVWSCHIWQLLHYFKPRKPNILGSSSIFTLRKLTLTSTLCMFLIPILIKYVLILASWKWPVLWSVSIFSGVWAITHDKQSNHQTYTSAGITWRKTTSKQKLVDLQ